MLDRFERFSFAISELSRYWHKITADEMEAYGLKGPYVVYFTTLYRYPEGLSAVKLGELCCRDKADVSRVISILEKKGLVKKEKTSKSQYRAPIVLTEEGRTLAKEMITKASLAVELGGNGLSDAQRETFYYALQVITSNLQTLSEGGLPAMGLDKAENDAAVNESENQQSVSAIKLILFDLDGTLLPMDQDIFVKTYFGLLAQKMAPYGYETAEFINVIRSGVASMLKNDGTISNEEAFWNTFTSFYGEKSKEHAPVFEEFYAIDFQQVQNVCGFNPDSDKTIKALKEKGYRLALATNPLFPAIATESRIRWAGLDKDDFEFRTTYENSGFCKPNPSYYKEILDKLQIRPEECLMVGNDVTEDMVAATLGMKVFLLTDNLINKENADLSLYPQGNLSDLLRYVENLN